MLLMITYNNTKIDLYQNTLKEPSYSSLEEARQRYVMLEYASKYFRKNVSKSVTCSSLTISMLTFNNYN